jgi:hypothetical protein
MRATAPLRGASGYPTSRIAADRMSAATPVRAAAGIGTAAAVRAAAGVESATTAGTTPTATGMGTATAVRTAAVGTMSTATATGTAAAVRTAAVGATVRTLSAMLSKSLVRGAGERDRYNRGKQEIYGREFHHFIFLHPSSAYLAKLGSRPAKQKEHRFQPPVHRMHMGRLKFQ